MLKQDILSKLTLKEKISLCVGMNFWMTKEYPEYDIPALFMSDGPNGLRKQNVEKSDHLGLNDSMVSVCYPSACTIASSWDRSLIEDMGDTLGREAAQEHVDIVLGPGINIKRSPLCGRNFEYYSEDPCQAGEMAAAFIKGMQKNPVSACAKHFAVNSQESRRKAINARLDERTLREIYLTAFEKAVKKGDVGAVMSSYNKINGVYPAENQRISREILRDEWGFEGILMTDWGAMDQIVPSIQAGLTIQMPGDDGNAASKMLQAVEEGRLTEEDINHSIITLFNIIKRLQDTAKSEKISPDECHKMAVRAAEGSYVLLKNEENILPLSSSEKIAVIGEMAVSPRYQGAGSSHVNVYKLDNALSQMQVYSDNLFYAAGYDGESSTPELIEEAVILAASCDKAVIFTGLPASYESESFDRTSISIPSCYVELIEKVSEANKNTVVVLSNGSVIEMPWLDKVKGLLETGLGGEGGGTAVASVLFGKTNPSGKLAETFPIRLEDTPSFLYTAVGTDRSDLLDYREGIFVGYRYYEKKKIVPLFPFGFGLSFTKFDYSNLNLSTTELLDNETLTVTLDVQNVGDRSGKEVVQLYVGRIESPVPCPIKELRDFEKVDLAPGEKKTISFTLDARAFSYYEEDLPGWYVPPANYLVSIGASSADIRLSSSVYVSPTKLYRKKFTRNSVLKDLLEDDQAFAVFEPYYNAIKPYLPFGLDKLDINADKMARSLLNNMTFNSLASYVGTHLTDDLIDRIIVALNDSYSQNT